MSGDCDSILKDVATLVAGAAGSLISAAIHYPIPLGSLVTAIFIFYKIFGRNPFTLSDRELRAHIARAVEIEHRYRRELEDLRRIKSRIEKGELKIENSLSLDTRIAQLDECVKMAKAKRMVAEAILMVKENIELFKKLFGEKGFDEIITNVDGFSELVEKELKKHGIKEVDLEGLTEYIRGLMPLILKEPDKYKKAQEEPEKEVQTEKPTTVEVEEVLNLLDGGSPQKWLELLKTLHSEGRKLKLPPGKHYAKKGYRNLLIALYSVDLDLDNLKKILEDKALLRIAEYLEKLRRGDAIEVDPTSSDLGYIDDVIQILCGKEVSEESGENMKVQVYEFPDANQNKVVIERRIIKDPSTGKALKVVVKKR